jgi:molybdate transport system substrate-binding protein
MTRITAAIALGAWAIAGTPRPTGGAGTQINAFITIGVQSAIEEIAPVFEEMTGDRIAPTWSTSAILNQRVARETPDLLISTRAGIDALIQAGRIAAGSDVPVARSGIGVAVRRGSPKPDISTPDALRRELLAARAISYSDPAAGGVSGVHFASVLERLGIAAQMKARTRFPPSGGFSATLLVDGDVELAIQQIPELASVAGAEVIGPLPGELQLVTTFVAGIPTGAAHAESARGLLRFLQSPRAAAVMTAKGLEPIPGTASSVR